MINYLRKIQNTEISLEDIRFIILSLFVFGLPFERFYSEFLLLILVVLTIIDFKASHLKRIPRKFWLFQFFFYLSLFGILNTSSELLNAATFQLEKQLAIFLMPLLLPLAIEMTESRKEFLLKTLVYSTLVCLIYLFIANYMIYKESGNNLILFNQDFSSFIPIHSGYLSMYIAMSFVYVVKELIGKIKVLNFLILFIYVIGLIFLASRANVIILLFITFFITPFFIDKMKIKSYFVISSVILSLIWFAFSNSAYLKDRFISDAMVDIGVSKELNAEPRISRWKQAVTIISEAPISGHGTGGEIYELKKKYKTKKLVYSYFMGYNAHNQFLSIGIKHGLIGLALMVIVLIIFFKFAIINKDFIYLSFLIILLANFLIENVLDTNKGVFFFALFNTLLGYQCIKKR